MVDITPAILYPDLNGPLVDPATTEPHGVFEPEEMISLQEPPEPPPSHP